MKKELIGIFVCMLLILTAIPVVGHLKVIPIRKLNDEINTSSNSDKWMKTYNLNKFDGGSSVQQTSDGGYILVGVTEQTTIRDDIWLIKTDNQGNIIWDIIFGERRVILPAK